jgi:uncharacterized alpha-E superfamily protein
MLSRVADSVFWMARYVERAENVARFVDVNHNLTLDVGSVAQDQWAPLVATTGGAEAFYARFKEATRENVLRYLAFDSQNSSSILSCLVAARENARTAREVISSDMWEELNRFYLLVSDALAAGRTPDYAEFFTQAKRASHLLIGTTDATMSHGEAWHFARMGRLLERADCTSRIVDVKYFILLPKAVLVGGSLDVVQWSSLLKSASALEMYRRCCGRIVPVRVVEFLLLNREFPRSVRHCLVKAEESLHAITGTPRGSFGNRAEQELGRLRSELEFTGIDDIIHGGMHEFIDQFQLRLSKAGGAVHDCFFELEPPTSVHSGQNSMQ